MRNNPAGVATAQPIVLPSSHADVTVDAAQRLVRFAQMATPFAIRQDAVVIPFGALKAIVAQILLAEAQQEGVGAAPNGNAPRVQ